MYFLFLGNLQSLLLDESFKISNERTLKWAIDVIQGKQLILIYF